MVRVGSLRLHGILRLLLLLTVALLVVAVLEAGVSTVAPSL
jgi:hypothetical protein